MLSKFKIAILLSAVIVLAACGSGSTGGDSEIKRDEASTAASKIDATCGLPNFDADILARVNAVRAAGAVCGGEVMKPVGPLTWNTQLKNAATVHVLDMAKNNIGGHTGTDGSTAVSRALAAGYPSSYVGENSAVGYRDTAAVMEGWLNSPPHCKGTMGSTVFDIGVSCMRSAAGRTYYSMSLGNRGL